MSFSEIIALVLIGTLQIALLSGIVVLGVQIAQYLQRRKQRGG
jgi:hypothetical protein